MQTIISENNEVPDFQADDNITLDIVRTKLREATLTKRKENRVSTWCKNRTRLGDCTGSGLFSPEYVSERAKLLKKKKISFEDYRNLPNALIQCEENINSFLNTGQNLSGLIRDLSGNNPLLQLYAANCCCNIALGNTKACTTLGKAVVPYLLVELESLNYALLDVCIWTIGNLIAGSNKAFSIFHVQHCLKYLILLLDNTDNTILSSVIYTLLHYVHIGFDKISEYEMVELVQISLKQNFLYEDPNYIWLLAMLSSSTTCATYLHSILPQIVDYLYESNSDNKDISEVTASIRILANTLHNCHDDVAAILLRNSKYSQEDLCNLLNKLLSHQYIHIRKEIIWLIGNLYNHRSLSVSKNIKDIIPLLSHISLNQAVLSIVNST